jgi:hypothetical protein
VAGFARLGFVARVRVLATFFAPTVSEVASLAGEGASADDDVFGVLFVFAALRFGFALLAAEAGLPFRSEAAVALRAREAAPRRAVDVAAMRRRPFRIFEGTRMSLSVSEYAMTEPLGSPFSRYMKTMPEKRHAVNDKNTITY